VCFSWIVPTGIQKQSQSQHQILQTFLAMLGVGAKKPHALRQLRNKLRMFRVLLSFEKNDWITIFTLSRTTKVLRNATKIKLL
jgi:hypothetical protein